MNMRFHPTKNQNKNRVKIKYAWYNNHNVTKVNKTFNILLLTYKIEFNIFTSQIWLDNFITELRYLLP